MDEALSTSHFLNKEPAQSVDELVTRLYEYGLKGLADCSNERREERVREALAQFIAGLLDLVRNLSEANPELSELECAQRAFKELRKPNPSARVHKSIGFRKRLLQLMSRSESLPRPAEFLAGLKRYEPMTEEKMPAIEVPPDLLEDIQQTLDVFWEKILERCLEQVRWHPSVKKRRYALLKIIAERVKKDTGYGFFIRQFKAAVRAVKPSELIAEARELKTFPTRGRKKVSESQIRRDIAVIKEELCGLDLEDMSESLNDIRQGIRQRYGDSVQSKGFDAVEREELSMRTQLAFDMTRRFLAQI